MLRLTSLPLLLFGLLVVGHARAELPTEEEAIKAMSGIASNIQKNRDGTVRFIRFSKPIVSDAHLANLPAFQHIDYLAVVSPGVTDAGLQHVRTLTNLDTLVLSNTQLTDDGLAAVAELEKLERLYLDGTQVTDAGLEHLANHKQLKVLSLAGNDVNGSGFEHLAALTGLEELDLHNTQVDDAALAKLAPFKQLRILRLDESKVTGPGLAGLADLSKLESLNLSRTTATLEALPKFKQLRRLMLYDVPLSAEQLADLRESRQKTNVYHIAPDADRRSALQRFLDRREASPPSQVAAIVTSTETTSEGSLLPAVRERYRLVTAETPAPDFQRHVVPLLTRLGCNGRSCHGSFQGQGGFRLSMFGYDFAADLEAIAGGDEPRVTLEQPDQSLFLQKPTEQVEHGGGQRYEIDSWEYRLLERWIRAKVPGTETPKKLVRLEVRPPEIIFAQPGEQVELQVIAHWEDGGREDVTCLTRFQTNDEGIAEVSADGRVESLSAGDTHIVAFYDSGVQPVPVLLPNNQQNVQNYPDVPQPTRIDELVVAKLAKLGIVPSELSSDEAFLRRASLDIAATLPTAKEVRSFLADESADKRARKIDELLESDAHITWWTNLLCDLTACNSQLLGTTDMNSPAAGQWQTWIRGRLEANAGWDEIAAGILLSRSRRPGQSYDDYAAEQSAFLRRQEPEDFAARDNPLHYYWFRSNLERPEDRTLSFGYIFLGVRLECAQCHKHPFDRWSKQDFEHFTEFFTRIGRGVAPDAADAERHLRTKLGVPTKLDTASLRRQMYTRVSAEGKSIPWKEIYELPPKGPQKARLLGGETVDLAKVEDPMEPLVAWLTRPDNPYFAKAMVNRVWAHYFGVGIIDPPDDINLANPPSNGPLLDYLAEEFVEHGYDLKWLHRTITNSRTYQLSWQPNETNAADTRNFARAQLRRLPAEVLIDAVVQATASEKSLEARRMDGRYINQHPRNIMSRGIDYSLLVFGKPLRTQNCDCERQAQPTLLQSLYVRNDREMLERLERADGWLQQVAGELKQPLVKETVANGKQVQPEAKSADAEPAESFAVEPLVQEAYLRTLSRLPTDEELQNAEEHLSTAENAVEGLRDLMWALLNTKEFLTNH